MTPQHRRQAFGMPRQAGRGKVVMSSVHDQFMSACVQRNEARFKELVNRVRLIGSKETINQTDAHGRTPLSHLCGHGSHRCVEDFARLKLVNVNLGDKEGNTPLHYAAQAGHAQVVEVLLDKFEGIEVDARNKLGITPLIKACITGKPKCVQLLLDKGADPEAKDPRRGLTAAQWAHLCSWPACARVLEAHALVRDTDRSADPAATPNSMTVLHSAATPNSMTVPNSEPVTDSSPIPCSATVASNGHNSEPDPVVDPDSEREGPWSRFLENRSPEDESVKNWLGPYFWAEAVQDPWSVEDPVPNALGCDSESANDSEPPHDSDPAQDSEPTHDSESIHGSKIGHDFDPAHDSEPAYDSDGVRDSEPPHDSDPAHDSEPVHDSEPADNAEPARDSEPAHDLEPVPDPDSVPENGDCVQWRLLQWFSESDLSREPAWLRERHKALTGGVPARRRSSLPDRPEIYRAVEPDTWRTEPEVPAIRVMEIEAPIDPVIVQYGDPVPPNQRAVQKNKMETLCLPGSGKGFAYE